MQKYEKTTSRPFEPCNKALSIFFATCFLLKNRSSHWSKDIERRAVAFNWQTVNQKNQFIILFKKLSCKRTITKIASIWKGTIWKTIWHLAISKAEDRFCRNFTAAKKLKLINKKNRRNWKTAFLAYRRISLKRSCLQKYEKNPSCPL